MNGEWGYETLLLSKEIMGCLVLFNCLEISNRWDGRNWMSGWWGDVNAGCNAMQLNRRDAEKGAGCEV